MTTKSAHTPTPWYHYEDDTNHWLERSDKTAFTGGLSGVMSNEDAAFICKAVNAHQYLYDALCGLVNAVSHQYPNGIPEPLRSVVVIADQAIASAEGGK